MTHGTGLEDTIVAVATPPGRGAIAVVRVSGVRAHEIVRACVTPWPSTARRASLCAVRGRGGDVIDRAIVTVFVGPHSFTGEDTVEIATHGGLVTPALVVAELIACGAREALPGEFTRRAVLNGRLDLVQAEAIGDVIDAGSRAMHRVALRQLDGGLSRRVAALREMVLEVESLIAYDIDFPEEDDGPVPRERVSAAVRELAAALDALLATAPAGEVVRVGAVAVIAGAPNAGKSSLFNALLGVDRAIVTEIPGTTRDAIEAVVDAGAWPVRLVDTAGLRETDDTLERIGIEVSARYLASADVVLACGETGAAVRETVAKIALLTVAPVIAVRTKIDVNADADGDDVDADTMAGDTAGDVASPVRVSAVTGEGIPDVLAAIGRAIASRHGEIVPDVPLLTRERHRVAVSTARDEVASFVRNWTDGTLPGPVAAVHLRTAAHALEELIGSIDVEDVFERLFRTFCIGK